MGPCLINADYLIVSEVIIVSDVILQDIGKIDQTKYNKCESWASYSIQICE